MVRLLLTCVAMLKRLAAVGLASLLLLVLMVTATHSQALDPAALAAGERPRLQATEAEQLAREYLARNLAATGDVLVASPSEIAAAAQVVISNEPGTDPSTGASNTAPTVSIEISAPARIPLLGLAGIGPNPVR